MLVKEARMDKLADLAKACEGQVIDGKFRLLKFLGGSGESAVFLTERGDGAPAVIKLVAFEDGADSERAQLARWAEAAKLGHPHLIRLFEMGHAELGGAGLLYLVMECAEQDLSQVLPERPLSAVETREMLEPTLQALAYIHGKGWVHGDLKPSNIMSVGNQLKLSSDRLSKADGPGRQKSKSKSNAYDAPEGGIASPADMWALGVTLVEALTQHLPGVDGVVRSEALPPPFGEIVRHCLVRDPERRSNAGDIMRRLQSAPGAESVVEKPIERPPQAAQVSQRPQPLAVRGPAEDEQRPPAHWRALTSILAPILAGAILLAFVVFIVKRFKPSPEPHPATTAASAPSQQNATLPAAPVSSGAAETPAPSVSVEGAVARQVQPEVSASALATIDGTVKVSVEVDVNSAGQVVDARFGKRGPSQYFATRAMKAARQWEFTPRKLRGESVPSTWTLHFEFKRSGTSATAKETAS